MNEKLTQTTTSENKNHGFELSDLCGIVLMFIPCIISIRFEYAEPGKFFNLMSGEIKSIRPNLLSMLCAVVFYISLLVRYTGIFRKENLFEIIVSSLRAALNCCTLAAMVSIALPKGEVSGLFRNGNPQLTYLILALLLSWLGMRTIAGYSWILFIFAAMTRISDINRQMGMLGAVFVLTSAISLILQIKNYADVRNFMSDFRGMVQSLSDDSRSNINQAVEDAKEKGQYVVSTVSQYADIPEQRYTLK